MEIKIEKNTNPKEKPDETNLGFGNYMTDHMFLMNYDDEQGWHDARIVPYGPIELEPNAVALHYAQETFEGLKAYRTEDGKIQLFRPDMNAKRINNSNKRLVMPEIPEEDFIQAVNDIVKVDQDWVPSEKDTSLYIRPFVFTNEGMLGLHTSKHFLFCIILSPVGAYYANGLDPVDIIVEENYVRAVDGGTGFTKCGGNYAASMLAQKEAEDKGFSQVLWLDGKEKKYVEEVGSMNIMFKINGEVYTAPIEGTVLPGVTRDSIIQILKDWDIPVHEERITIDEIMEKGKTGELEEIFGTGTAAVISPVKMLSYKGEEVTVNDGKIGDLTQKLYDELTGIQWGRLEDKHNWTREVK